MPIYAYRCDHCGVQFERRQSFSDDPLTVCPECDEPALRKLIQPVGVVFKGSGFYVTDSRGVNGQRSSSTSSSSGKDTGEAKSTSEDSKASSSESKSNKDD